MSEQSEAYRLRMLRYLKNRYGKAKPIEVLKAEDVIANFREEKARSREAIKRLGSPLPKPDLCAKCWFIYGRESTMYTIPHPTHPMDLERWRCHRCHHLEDRDAREGVT